MDENIVHLAARSRSLSTLLAIVDSLSASGDIDLGLLLRSTDQVR